MSNAPPDEDDESNARRPNDTKAALDEMVGGAAEEVERALDADGVPERCVTPRDVLRSRHPRDTIDDEAVTEELSDDELFGRPPSARDARIRSLATPNPTPPAGWRTHPPSGTSSLSPLSVAPRTSSAPPPPGPRPSAHARRVASSGPEPRRRTPSLLSRAPSAGWVLLIGTLGGLAAFTTVLAMRTPGPDSEPAPLGRAAAAGPAAPLVDAAVPMVPDAAVTIPPAPKVRR